MTDLDNIETLTVQEVNARLPLVRRIMEDLQSSWQRCQEVRSRLEQFRSAEAGGGSGEVSETIQRLRREEKIVDQEIRGLEEEINQLGGIVRDPGRGGVDFFSVRDGHLIFLTWMLGEEEVGFWHEIDTTPVDRRPLSEKPDFPVNRE